MQVFKLMGGVLDGESATLTLFVTSHKDYLRGVLSVRGTNFYPRKRKRLDHGERSAINSRFVQWLSFKPEIDEITKALATDFLHVYGVSSVRFVALHASSDIEIIGEYGFDQNRVGESTQAMTWRSWSGPDELIALTSTTQCWDSTATMCSVPIYNRSVTAGFISLVFIEPRDKTTREEIQSEVESYAAIVGLYLSLTETEISLRTQRSLHYPLIERPINESVELTERQLKILKGMASGKTNHALALDLGYSVSTIRHETMRIFNLLNVSDRKSSAQAALALGLI